MKTQLFLVLAVLAACASSTTAALSGNTSVGTGLSASDLHRRCAG